MPVTGYKWRDVIMVNSNSLTVNFNTECQTSYWNRKMISWITTGCVWWFWKLSIWQPGQWFNIKMLSYQYRKSHCGDKTILWPSYLHNEISFTGKMASLYWIRASKCHQGFSSRQKRLHSDMDENYKQFGKTEFIEPCLTKKFLICFT